MLDFVAIHVNSQCWSCDIRPSRNDTVFDSAYKQASDIQWRERISQENASVNEQQSEKGTKLKLDIKYGHRLDKSNGAHKEGAAQI